MKVAACVFCALAWVAQAQVFTSMEVAPSATGTDGVARTPGPRPTAGSIFRVDVDALRTQLRAAPEQRFDAPLHTYGMVMTLPAPDGHLVECRVAHSPVMEPELQAKFPQMRTYLVETVDRTATGRFELTQRGLTAMLRSTRGTWMIDVWQSADPAHVVSYYMHNLPGGQDWTCHTTEGVHGFGAVEEPGYQPRAVQTSRTLRLAVACTGEYGLYHSTLQGHAPNTADPLAAIVTVVGRTNVVYEQDLAVHFNLVANNDLLIFTNPDTDPYVSTCGGSGGTDCSGEHLSVNIATLRDTIGNANFDIGHLVTRIFGGVAYLSSICTSNKAGGVSGIPRGGDIDPFAANVVIHEIGHQFGANHTFSGTRGRCQGNVRLASAWEAGSGSSPMAYAGGCPVGDAPPTDNVVLFADPFFHHGSWGEMTTLLGNRTCPVQSATSNNIPVITSTTPNLAIPPGTPFVLTASAIDQDNDPLTYSWEQFDAGVARPLTGPDAFDNGQGSLFRIFPPQEESDRYFPRLADILSNISVPGEMLPTVTGVTRRFRVIVRDNAPGAGGVAVSGFTDLTIAPGTSPFVITSPSASEVIRSESFTVQWSVGNTDLAPVNAAFVTVRLSTDGGATFPLSFGTFPNTGSATIPMPTFEADNLRLRIDPVGNVFFAISPPFSRAFPCVADVDDGTATGTPDGGVTIDDLLFFLGIFEAGSLDADMDDGSNTGTPDGGVTIDDLLYYLVRYVAGC
jgi:hypothetical protein